MTTTKKLERPRLPLPEPLSVSEIGSFAQLTILKRLPAIGRDTLATSVLPAETNARLAAMIAELPYGEIRRLSDPGAPDEAAWEGFIRPYLGKTWLEIPWFFAETYFYRRILEATAYFQPGRTYLVDPFLPQKRQVLEAAEPVYQTLAELLPEFIQESGEAWLEPMYRLLLLNLWGNQSDLSVWSMDDEGRPNHTSLEIQQAHLLVDDSARVFAVLAGANERSLRIDFILDNAGPELLYDLALTDFLLTLGIAREVRYHTKAHPVFVSDTLTQDVLETVTYLGKHRLAPVRELGERLSEHLNAGRLELAPDYFWTSPLPFWEQPGRLASELAQADLIVSKGDANYRRLLGDLHWQAETPVDQVLNYIPAPLVAVRVCKAEVSIGLKPGQAEALERIDPDWQIDGRWGMIQFAGSAKRSSAGQSPVEQPSVE